MKTDSRIDSNDKDSDDMNFQKEKHRNQEPDKEIQYNNDSKTNNINDHEVQVPVHNKVRHRKEKHLRSSPFLNKKKRSIKQVLKKK